MGQHWYTTKGEPMHWIDTGKGQRDTTLRDARKLNLLPSVTTIIGILDKPALTKWKMKQVLLASLTLPAIENESPDDFANRIMRDAFTASDDARDRGSLIHDCIEASVKDDESFYTFDADIRKIANQALKTIEEYIKVDILPVTFTAEATVAGNGYAGMIDLHNDGFDLHSDKFLIDWKTKDIKPEQTGKYLAWPEMAMQLAAYDTALGGNKRRRCINVFIDRTEPGLVRIHEWTLEEIELAWCKFELLLKLWQMDKDYYPEPA